MDCVIIKHDILRAYNCNLGFLLPLHLFQELLFLTRSAVNSEEQKMNARQRINQKFSVRLEKSLSQTLKMLLLLYGDSTM